MSEEIKIINTVEKDDRKYEMLVGGINPQAPQIVAALGVNLFDIQRFRDAGYDIHHKVAWILTKTGSGRAFKECTNEPLTKVSYYQSHGDDPFDNTYEVYLFRLPRQSAFKHTPVPDMKTILDKAVARQERGEWNDLELAFMNKLRSML